MDADDTETSLDAEGSGYFVSREPGSFGSGKAMFEFHRQKAKARKTQRKGKCSLIRWIYLIRISCSSIPRVSQEVRMA